MRTFTSCFSKGLAVALFAAATATAVCDDAPFVVAWDANTHDASEYKPITGAKCKAFINCPSSLMVSPDNNIEGCATSCVGGPSGQKCWACTAGTGEVNICRVAENYECDLWAPARRTTCGMQAQAACVPNATGNGYVGPNGCTCPGPYSPTSTQCSLYECQP